MEKRVPRVLLAGTGSGCGKTTVTCAVLQALVDRGIRPGAFKCGPDYIDPMFHSRIIGAKSANLDGFFFDGNTLRLLLARNGVGCGVSVIEGVMGYYDGVGAVSTGASSWATAKAVGAPAVLILPARGAALSTLAVLQGFLTFQPDSRIRGVLFNRCSKGTYQVLAEAVRQRFGGVEPLGYLPDLPECGLESRHLGLVTAAEVADLREKLELLSRQAEESVDLDGLIRMAESAPPLRCRPLELERFAQPVRIAVARDRAFCFYYEDSLAVLEALGAELTAFSPLEDPALPEGTDGIYLGGGYPELYARQLAENSSMRRAVRRALEEGTACIAECGGFMYLTEAIGDAPMVGALPGTCFDNGHLTRFGYVTLRAKRDNLLCRAGEEIRCHEFHYWDARRPGADFTAVKPSGRSWDCAVATEQLYAGFPHFHFYANPACARRFYEACLRHRERRGG